MGHKCLNKQCRFLRSSLSSIYTVCHSIYIFWRHYCIVKSNCLILRTITAVSLGVPIFRVFTVLQINYFEQKNLNVGLEKKKKKKKKKKKQPLPNFTRYGWNRMAKLSDQLFPTLMSKFLLQLLDIQKNYV